MLELPKPIGNKNRLGNVGQLIQDEGLVNDD